MRKKVCGWHSQPLSLQVAGLIQPWLGICWGTTGPSWPLVHNHCLQKSHVHQLAGTQRLCLRPWSSRRPGCYSSQAKASFSLACRGLQPPRSCRWGNRPQAPVFSGSLFLFSIFLAQYPQAFTYIGGKKYLVLTVAFALFHHNWF